MNRIKHTLIIIITLCLMLCLLTPFAIADEGGEPGDGYEEWQTESDEYTEDTVSIKIKLSGIDSVELRIADSETWESVSDGDTIHAIRANSIEVKGIEGCWLSAAYGETKEEAEDSPAANISESEGANTSTGVDNDGYLYIRAATSRSGVAGNAAVDTEDQDGNVTWNEVSNAQADAGTEKPTSTYKVGQKFYGKATAVSRVPRDGGSTITFRHDNGWIKNETKVKTITAVCISGHTRGLAYVGAVFNYVATIKKISGNRIKIQVVYYPRKNKPNTWYGSMAPKAQIMARTLWVSQYPHTGYVCLKKTEGTSTTDFLEESPNNYSLKGASYCLYTDSACTSVAKDTDGNAIVLTTNENGMTNTVEVELGGSSKTFWAKETAASAGYKLDPAVHSVTVTTENSYNDPAVISSSEPPSMGIPDFKVYKLDPSGRYGWNKLRGAEYRISYYDVTSKEEISSASPKRSWVFTTRKIEGESPKDGNHAGFDWKEDEAVEGSDGFYLESGKRIIPCGWFTIQEIKAPSGLALDDTVVYGRVYQPANGASAEVAIEGAGSSGNGSVEVTVQDAPQAVKLIIDKKDASTGQNTARETEEKHSSTRLARFASLAGAEYEVYYDDDDLSSPELVGKIVTDENGHGELETRTLGDERFIGDKLTVGDYLIREVKASPGFVVDSYILSKDTQKIRDDETIEVICGYDAEGNAVTKIIKGKYSDGCHAFRTRAESENTNVFSYTVSSFEEPVRTYIRKTDAATGDEIAGAALQIISDNDEDRGTVVEQWVSSKQEHLVWELPEGRYILREISAPYGYDIAEDIRFEIKAGVIINRLEMKNKPIVISTSASDAVTDTHHGVISEEEYVRDTVVISGLYGGRTYLVSGRLVDKDTGETLKDSEGNEVSCEKEFTATGDTARVEMLFKPDSSEYTGETASVGFEKLYRTNSADENEKKEIAKHEDLAAEAQTIHFGGILRTSAHWKKSGTQMLAAGKKVTLIDTVEYGNLSPEETYTIEGELYDKTDGRLTGITSETELTPEVADGTTEVVFRFDAREYEGHALVVFETLKLNGRVIDEHADPDDKDQTVQVKKGSGPDTADNSFLWMYTVLAGSCTISLVVMIIIRLKNQL